MLYFANLFGSAITIRLPDFKFRNNRIAEKSPKLQVWNRRFNWLLKSKLSVLSMDTSFRASGVWLEIDSSMITEFSQDDESSRLIYPQNSMSRFRRLEVSGNGSAPGLVSMALLKLLLH